MGFSRTPGQSPDVLQVGVASERATRNRSKGFDPELLRVMGFSRTPGQSPDVLQVGVASERLKPDDARRIIIAMATESPPKLLIPRWIQLVTLPLLLLLVWAVAGAVRHVLFLFMVAALVALLLNPLVRGITRFWIPRGVGVAVVYLCFAAPLPRV